MAKIAVFTDKRLNTMKRISEKTLIKALNKGRENKLVSPDRLYGLDAIKAANAIVGAVTVLNKKLALKGMKMIRKNYVNYILIKDEEGIARITKQQAKRIVCANKRSVVLNSAASLRLSKLV